MNVMDFRCRDTMEVNCGILHLLPKQLFQLTLLKNIAKHSEKHTCSLKIHRYRFTSYLQNLHQFALVDHFLVLSPLFVFPSWQVLEDCPGDLNYWYRHISKGAWPFSTADHGWPISDCTAEGLKVIIDQRQYFVFLFSSLLSF